MWLYWLIFLSPAAASFDEREVGMTYNKKQKISPVFIAFSLFLIVVIGSRYQVGGDWYNYIYKLENLRYTLFEDLLNIDDFGYNILSKLSIYVGADIVGVNFICGMFFVIGLSVFCASTSRPWLAIAVSIPYLVIVVGMGYTRQSAALGFVMLALVFAEGGGKLKFVSLILMGGLFHKTAILLLPIIALSATTNRIWSLLWLGAASVIGFYFFLQSDVDRFSNIYIGGEMQSDGALIRLMMNAVPAAIFIFYKKNFNLAHEQEKLWGIISLISIGLLAVFFVMPSSSTALDRIALYFLPLQIFVFSRLPGSFGRGNRNSALIVNATILYYGVVMMVWLNFGVWSTMWLPYDSIFIP